VCQHFNPQVKRLQRDWVARHPGREGDFLRERLATQLLDRVADLADEGKYLQRVLGKLS
jgi:hypothetical protein